MIDKTDNRKLYKGSFTWSKKDHVLTTRAVSEKKAFGNMMYQLSKDLDVNIGIVTNYYKNKADAYKIEEI